MTLSEIAQMVASVGLPYAYNHFTKDDTPGRPPFLAYLIEDTDNFIADGVTYAVIAHVAVELYTDQKSPALEKKVEHALNQHELPWNRFESWIEEEKLYEVRYEFETLMEDEESEDNS